MGALLNPRRAGTRFAEGRRRASILLVTVVLLASGLAGLPGIPGSRPEGLRSGPSTWAGLSDPDHGAGADAPARPAAPPSGAAPGPAYRVAQTLVLPNDSLRSGEFDASNGLNPEALVYDSGRGELFVANTMSNSVSVVNGTTGRIVGTVAVGPEPASLAYDASRGTIYVANGSYASVSTGQSSIWAINDTTYQGAAIPTGAEPNAVAYDPTNEEVFVANSGANTVTVINATTDTPTANVSVPSTAWGIAYDPWLNEVIVVLTAINSVSLIDAGNLTLRTTQVVGTSPYVATAAGPSGEVVVANEGSNNVTLLNGSSGKVVASVAVGSLPDAVQYDPATGTVFVANGNSNNLTLLNVSRRSVVASVPVGAGPDALALGGSGPTLYVAEGSGNAITFVNASTGAVGPSYLLGLQPVGATLDPLQNELFIGDSGSDLVSVVNLTGPSIVQNISVPDTPSAGAFDPSLDELAIAESNGSDLAVISGGNSTLVGQIPVGSDPDAVAYASDPGDWIVADAGSGTVSIVNASDGASVANLTVGTYPDSIALVPGRPLAIVANGYSDNLSLINLTTLRVVKTLPGGLYPAGVVFDGETGQIVVADALSGELEAENLTGGNLTAASVGAAPVSVAVDASTGVWATVDQDSDRLAFVSAVNGTVEEHLGVGSDPTQALVDPETGTIYVVNLGAASLTVVVPQLYAVTAGEFGLPGGTLWSVSIAGGPTFDSTEPTMTWNATNGSYAYTVASPYPDRIDPLPGAFVVQGSAADLSFLFRQPFNVSVTETGTPIGSAWWLNLSDGQSFEAHQGSLTFEEVNGSYRFVATSSVPDRAPVTGWLNLSGAALALALEFRQQYPVTFVASGTVPGASWSLNLSNGVDLTSGGPSLSVALVNGTYGYRASAPAQGRLPVDGNLTVAGVPLALSIRFVPFQSPVTFEEDGLPAGIGWSVHFENGTTLTGTGPTISFAEPNGSYTYTISATDPSYGAPGGSYRVDGRPVIEPVEFSLPTYAVRFVPSGLPAGTAWWISMPGVNRSTSGGGPLTFSLPNGSYPLSAGSVNGSYRALPSLGVVDGQARTISIPFAPVTYAVSWATPGLPNGTGWSLSLGGRSFTVTTPYLELELMNGSYPYRIRAAGGFTPVHRSGLLVVSGHAESVADRFLAPLPTTGPSVGLLAVGGIGVLLAAGAVVAVLIYRRRRSRGTDRIVWEPPQRGA